MYWLRNSRRRLITWCPGCRFFLFVEVEVVAICSHPDGASPSGAGTAIGAQEPMYVVGRLWKQGGEMNQNGK